MDLLQLSTDELARKLAERMAWFNEVIDFVTSITCEYGERLEHKVHSAHTYSKYELNGVRDFSFSSEGAYSMMGGENIRIWYSEKRGAQSKEVLFLEWWLRTDIHVKTCVCEEKWTPALRRLMRDKKKVFALKKRQEQKDKVKQELQLQEVLRRKILLEQAAKLGL